jgi:hypothetical protein
LNKNLTDLIEDVYVELGMDHLQSKPFNRRMVARLINRGIGYLSSKGINGRWWQNDAVPIVAGTTLYTYASPAHTDSAVLVTTPRGISAVRRDSDGQQVRIIGPDRLNLMHTTPNATQGRPEFVAFHITGEANATDSNRSAVKVLVYPTPRENENLDFYLSTIQSMRFEEYDITWEIDYPDEAEMALVLVVAAELASRVPEMQAMASGFKERGDALIAEESMRQYSMQLADDIVQVER